MGCPVSHNKAMFDSDGVIGLKIDKPQDANCLLCHQEAQTKQLGHVSDGLNPDVHASAGMKCVTCDTAGEYPVFPKQ